eukprot:6459738-Amphidinium_carterae.1
MIVNARHLVCRALGVSAVSLSGDLSSERVFDTDPEGGDPRDSLSFTFHESDDNTSDYGFSLVKCLRDLYGIEANHSVATAFSTRPQYPPTQRSPSYNLDVLIVPPPYLPITLALGG